VNNLPFSLNDDGLFNLFRETNPLSAHVQVSRTGRSRGYGFVEYDNQGAQQNAITKLNGSMVEDGPDRPPRKIVVLVSVASPQPVQTDQNQNQNQSQNQNQNQNQ